MRRAYIYKITSPSGRIYVGSTDNPKRRMSCYAKSKSTESQIRIFRSIKKYGWDHHRFEIILVTTELYRNIAERLLGDYYGVLGRRGLNLSLPKIGSYSGISEYTRNKMKEAHKRRTYKPCSKETKIKISAANRGRRPSKEAINNSLKSRKEKPVSEETRQKISIGNRGKEVSTETRIKISKANKGKIISKEAREKMRKAKLGVRNERCIANLIFVSRGEKRHPSLLAAMHESKRKKVVNDDTGQIFPSISIAAAQLGLSYSKAKAILGNTGNYRRTHNIRFYEPGS